MRATLQAMIMGSAMAHMEAIAAEHPPGEGRPRFAHRATRDRSRAKLAAQSRRRNRQRKPGRSKGQAARRRAA